MLSTRVFSIFALLVAVGAQNSTTTLALLGFSPQSLVGSIIASDVVATTYLLKCGNPTKCWLSRDLTFTQGPSTLRYVAESYEIYGATGLVDVTLSCVLTSHQGDCGRTVTGSGVPPGMATISSVVKKTDYEAFLVPVTITAGPGIRSGVSAATQAVSTSSGALVTKFTTTSLFLMGFDSQSILASVVASDATATTYSLECGDLETCGIGPSFTIVQGPSTVRWDTTGNGEDGGLTTYSKGCVMTTDHGSCSLTMKGLAGTLTTTWTEGGNFNKADYQSALLPVTITAGPVITTSSMPTATSASSTPSKSGTAVVDAGSASSSSSKAGAPRITNGPILFAGGAAAAFAFAAM